MADDQVTHNTGSSFFFNGFPASPALSRLSSSVASSFSTVTCWDELKYNKEEDHVVNDDVVETFNCMDFTESIIWDDHGIDVSDHESTSDFLHKYHGIDVSDYENISDFQHKDLQIVSGQQQEQSTAKITRTDSNDPAVIFLEWLKLNKGMFSAEDLRKVKLKRSTIESSIQHFGGGKEGMKKLLELILEWVQNHHICSQGKRMRVPEELPHSPIKQNKPNPGSYPNFTALNGTNDPNGATFIAHSPTDHNPCFSSSNWNIPHIAPAQPPQPLPYAEDSTTMAAGTTSETNIDFNDPYQHTGDCPWSSSKSAVNSYKRSREDKRQKQV